jgi:1,4-dihydroxy-2-naphthoate octaprenyltransferase
MASRWILAMRPRTLPAAATPVVVGAALAAAWGGFRAGPAIAALAGALLLQIGANFANDVFDFDKGADGPDRLGPTRAVAAGLITPRDMRLAMSLTFVVATAIGVYLVAIGGLPILCIGIGSILAAVAYTGGPYPLGYHGLGEIFVFLFFGVAAVCGTVYVEVGRLDPRALLCALPIGLLASAIIVVNNLRDRHTDARVGKRTLAVRLGREGTLLEYRALLAVAYLSAPLLAFVLGRWGALAPLVSLPLALSTERKLRATDGAALNPLLGETARLLAVYGLLLAVGLFVGR